MPNMCYGKYCPGNINLSVQPRIHLHIIRGKIRGAFCARASQFWPFRLSFVFVYDFFLSCIAFSFFDEKYGVEIRFRMVFGKY